MSYFAPRSAAAAAACRRRRRRGKSAIFLPRFRDFNLSSVRKSRIARAKPRDSSADALRVSKWKREVAPLLRDSIWLRREEADRSALPRVGRAYFVSHALADGNSFSGEHNGILSLVLLRLCISFSCARPLCYNFLDSRPQKKHLNLSNIADARFR